VQRKIPRRLRHFTAPPVVQFSDDPDGAGTVLRLECNDQPGLLSRVAAAIFSQNVQVHNARIATFGEKVEDTFLLSDSDHRPLAPGAMEALAESIRSHLQQG
jgi:[protein-PII] uridylyltransferase